MTEDEWVQCNDPNAMYHYLETLKVLTTARRIRLLACGSVRLAWTIFDKRSRRVIEAMEQFVESPSNYHCLDGAMDGLFESVERKRDNDRSWRRTAAEAVLALTSARHESYPGIFAVHAGIQALVGVKKDKSLWQSKELQPISEIIRDIFGNPFRPVTLDPRWLSSSVLDLARSIYDERAFERLPILADALMDAGCDSEEMINHCRGPGPHVRGCWVVDLILGKN